MRSINIGLVAGGWFGFTAVALGAYADHVLKVRLSPHDFASLETALHYQLLHAAVLAALSLSGYANLPKRVLRAATFATTFFAIGIMLFCGGIYLGILANMPWVMHLAPIGGISLMIGWLTLAASGIGITKA
jgi:uncharacterized membrane protein YgdD (TMEM256/DUF423 family)